MNVVRGIRGVHFSGMQRASASVPCPYIDAKTLVPTRQDWKWVVENQALIVYVISKTPSLLQYRFNQRDLINYAIPFVIKSLNDYKVDGGNNRSTHVYTGVMFGLKRMFRDLYICRGDNRAGAKHRAPLLLGYYVPESSEFGNKEQEVPDESLVAVSKGFKCLDERRQDILSMWLGLGEDGVRKSMKVIANKYEISHERVSQLIVNSLTKLRISVGYNGSKPLSPLPNYRHTANMTTRQKQNIYLRKRRAAAKERMESTES